MKKKSTFFLTLNCFHQRELKVITFTFQKSALCLQKSVLCNNTAQVAMENISRKLIHFTDNTCGECVSEIKAFSLPSSYFCYCKTYAYSYYIPSHCGKNSKSKKILCLSFKIEKIKKKYYFF